MSSSPPSSVSSMPPGTRIAGRYRVMSALGRGGMGRVYRVVDETSGQNVALKRAFFPKERAAKLSALFEREYQTLAVLDHPSIIRVFDFGRDAQGPYYTMELLQGQDLRELSPLPYRDACRYLRDIASSLALLHARRLVHRDISAGNVRLSGDDRAKLIDFGALANFGSSKDVIGTPPCIPPEAIRGQALDQRSDLFSFGALLYFALTGRHAYPARDLAQLHGVWQVTPAAPSMITPGIPEALDELVLSLLSLEQIARPHSAAAVIEQLNVIAELPADAEQHFAEAHLRSAALVGRERELHKLMKPLDALKERPAQAVLISGPAGIGKTRLLAELTLRARLGGTELIQANAEAHREPYGVARELALELIDVAPDAAVSCATPHIGVLGHIIPELRERLPESKLEVLPKLANERRARLQRALGDWFSAVLATAPLVITLDNAELADDASLALVASLARSGTASALLVVVAVDPAHPRSAAVKAQIAAEATIEPSPLSHQHVEELVRGLFDDAAHSPRVARVIHESSGGNPGHCLELARYLILNGHIQYSAGAWVLPQELPRDQLPSSVEDVLLASFQKLDPAARDLALRLSVCRTAFSLSLATKLVDLPESAVLRQIDELTVAEIITVDASRYRFSNERFRTRLFAELDSTRKQAVHVALAAALNEGDGGNHDDQLESGYHLLQSGELLAGARRIALASVSIIAERAFSMELIAAMELALRTMEAQGAPEAECLMLRARIAGASYSLDHRIADRHGALIMARLQAYLGLSIASRLAPLIGEKLAIRVGSLIAMVRHVMRGRPRSEIMLMYQLLMTAWLSLIGVATVCLDPKQVGRLIAPMRVIRGFGPYTFPAMAHTMAERMHAQILGREPEAERLAQGLLETFRDPRVTGKLAPTIVQGMTGGALFGLAMMQAMRGDGSVHKTLQALRELGVAMYEVVAEQTAMVAHAYRGETAAARQYQQRVEMLAPQGGSTWQSEIFEPANLLVAHYLTGDIVALKHARQQLARRGAEIPSIARFATFASGLLQLSRGRYAEAVATLEPAIADVAPRELVGWAATRAALAGGYRGIGQPERAHALCTETLAHMSPADQAFPMMYVHVERELARTESTLGQHAAARARLEQLLARYAPQDVALLQGLLHRDSAEIELADRCYEAAERHVDRARHYFRITTNDALIASAEQLAARIERRRARPQEAGSNASTTSELRTLFEHGGSERARVALQMIAQRSGATDGFLILFEDGAPYVAAALHGEPPVALMSASAALRDDDVQTEGLTTGDESDAGSSEVSTAYELCAEGSTVPLRPFPLFAQAEHNAVVGVVWLSLGSEERPYSVDHSLINAVAQALTHA